MLVSLIAFFVMRAILQYVLQQLHLLDLRSFHVQQSQPIYLQAEQSARTQMIRFAYVQQVLVVHSSGLEMVLQSPTLETRTSSLTTLELQQVASTRAS
jgi:hypothetical protein